MTDGVDPALVDLDRLAAWMDAQGLPSGPFGRVETLAGGTQNVLVRFERGGREYVLRRPPRHLRRASNEVLRREARVLAALAGSDVPHPGLIAACPDESVLGVVFYLMEPVDGFNPTAGLPAPYSRDESWRHAAGLDVVDGIAALGAVDHEAVGLGDFGKPDGFLERQVGRWMHELDTYGELDGYGGPRIPQLDRVAAWLEANRPRTWTPGIMHGDYHLANVLLDRERPRLAAIVDWEMCTIGDPLLDLGWLLAMWPVGGAELGVATSLADVSGFPGPGEVIARYAERSARDLSAIDWYTVLACFKCGIILEGTHARACAGKADKGVGDLLHAITLALFAKADTYL
ncbi:phosphotransferase family protein [Bailinhaonella thermotolerans]|uniref:Phosphotransferase family protein n=1 Tax=Bailinhaonella thermotolerans TaxID=1070861 RepID=A0A3A4B107_9ACTN|nr:phosphotransferase family protein [Bailinhaonella thermotolerans]RJL31773.1 phosphotransferase family protein [Bailinhaonella thermotolerans]